MGLDKQFGKVFTKYMQLLALGLGHILRALGFGKRLV